MSALIILCPGSSPGGLTSNENTNPRAGVFLINAVNNYFDAWILVITLKSK
jgi:hypothetical protein